MNELNTKERRGNENEMEIPGSFHSPGSLPEVHFHLWNSGEPPA